MRGKGAQHQPPQNTIGNENKLMIRATKERVSLLLRIRLKLKLFEVSAEGGSRTPMPRGGGF